MPIHGFATAEEKSALASELSLLYLKNRDISKMSPKELAEKYLDVKEKIYEVLAPLGRL